MMMKVTPDKIIPMSNSNPRRKKVVVATLVVLLTIGVVFIDRNRKLQVSLKQPANEVDKYIPKPTPKLSVPSSNKVTVSDVVVDNFYREAEVINAKGDLALNADNVREKGYSIIYFPLMDQFNISILKSPFDSVRKNAESDFVKIMGNEKSELCKLNVVVTTPRFANPTEARKNYRLSWCE